MPLHMAGGKIDQWFKDTGARVIATAIVGGTASKISGGKFANGAITAAFMKAYNDANHQGNSKFPSAPYSPLAKWLRSLGKSAAQLRSSVEGAASEVGGAIGSLANDPARTAANGVAIAGAGVCVQTGGVGCVVAATAAAVGASDIMEQTTGFDPIQRGAEKVFSRAGMTPQTARQAAISVNVPGALTGAGTTTNMFKAISLNQSVSAANAYLSVYSVASAQKEVQGND